ncbi:MAG: hypothetical protein Kow0069_05090 [Promethearchaeota archaeon]
MPPGSEPASPALARKFSRSVVGAFESKVLKQTSPIWFELARAIFVAGSAELFDVICSAWGRQI